MSYARTYAFCILYLVFVASLTICTPPGHDIYLWACVCVCVFDSKSAVFTSMHFDIIALSKRQVQISMGAMATIRMLQFQSPSVFRKRLPLINERN